jgi:predicted phosphodiesterase
MIRKFLRQLLQRPLTSFVNKISSAPDKKDVTASLDDLLAAIRKGDSSRGPIVPFPLATGRFIIFSDQHKGTRDNADDFRNAVSNYSKALDHYLAEQFTYINLGDCEELWENTPDAVMTVNHPILEAEARFIAQNRYYRIFGNHDLEWKYPFQQKLYLQPVFGKDLQVNEGLELTTSANGKAYSIFLAHGHQGDKRSDGNPFSTWVVAAIWTPIQRFLGINVNTLSASSDLVDAHNIIMYQWSAAQQNLLFISGHTHKPVFASLDHIDLLHYQLQQARITGDEAGIATLTADIDSYSKQYPGKKFVKMMAYPSYFNSGCCCFNDGDISGIEIADGWIRLIKWEGKNGAAPHRVVWQESPLDYIFSQLPEGTNGVV